MKVLYFAWLRQRIGTGEEEIDPPADVTDVDGLVAYLKARGPGHAEAFKDTRAIKVAVDQDFADFAAPIAGAREVAFFPPVTGG